MNPGRLPRRGGAPTPSAPTPAPTPVSVPTPAPLSAPAAPATAAPTPAQGEAFTGLDPLTRSLIEAAPTVPASSAPSTTPLLPPTQVPAAPGVARRGLKGPAILVALGGTLAAGLLVITGARLRREGQPARAGQPTRAAAPNLTLNPPAPILPVNVPAPSAWLVAGGGA